MLVTDPVALDAEIDLYIQEHSLAEATSSSYAYGVRWLEALAGKPSAELTPGDLIAVIRDLAAGDYAGSTMDNLLAAANYDARLAGRADPTADPAVRQVLAGAKRKTGHKVVRSHPVTIATAKLLIGPRPDAGLKVTGRRIVGLLAAAGATTAEITQITPSGITITPHGVAVTSGDLQLTINAGPPGTHPDLCPVGIFERWLRSLPESGLDRPLLAWKPEGGKLVRTTASTAEKQAALEHESVRRALGGQLGSDPWRIAVASDPKLVAWIQLRLLISVGLCLGSRILDWRDVSISGLHRAGAARIITLGRTKTNRDRGDRLSLLPAQVHLELCPVTALDEWTRLVGNSDGYLFCAIAHRRITPNLAVKSLGVSLMLKAAARRAVARDPACGLDPSRFSSRSLR